VSSPPAPPGALRVLFLLARVALRRFANRAASSFRRKKGDAPRSGTPRKGGSGLAGLVLLGAVFLSYGFSLSYSFFEKLGDNLDLVTPDLRIVIPAATLEALQHESLAIRHPQLYPDEKEDHRQKAKDLLTQAAAREPIPEAERAARADEWMKVFEEKDASGFRTKTEHPRELRWTEPDRRDHALRAVGLFLFLLAFSQVWLGLGQGNQDLGRVEWSLEWLFSFPAPAGRLFLAKILEGTLINPIGWFLILPFLGMMHLTSRHDPAWFPIGALSMLFLSLVLSSIRVVAETWLRMTLPLNRLKNVQALSTLVGTLLWLAILAIALAKPTPAIFLRAAPRIPNLALWNPLSLPVLLAGKAPLAAAAAMGAFAILSPLAAVALCRHFVRDGLLAASGAYQGTRRAVADAARERKGLFRGVLAKDVRLLLRDRNFLVTTLVVPVILFAFQMVLNPALVRGVSGDYRHAATLAYGLGAYILMSSAFSVLSVEGGSLWLLYTFPRELHSILIQKTVLWAGVALLYAGIVLGVTATLNRGLDLDALALGVTAAVGVVISAFTCAALGTLSTDPLQNEPQRKSRAEIVYLYMLLSSMYGYHAIYGPSRWARLVQVVLSALLVLALWQKVRDRLPYLLDPTETPPPSIALSDGLIATLAFFVVQGLVFLLLTSAEMPMGQAMLVSYVAAGGLISLFTLYLFWRLKVPRLFEAVGLRAPSTSTLRSLLLGLLAGIAAAALGLGYLWVVAHVDALRTLARESAELAKGLPQGTRTWMAILAIGAAPLFEEYLFRGLVFKGLRRSMKPAFAILASAAIFAIVHPPLAFVPVFGLGVAAALAFEGSRSLLAPILAHAVYNAAVVLLSH
jgi:membrane protease YdiL (CAAX protease family)